MLDTASSVVLFSLGVAGLLAPAFAALVAILLVYVLVAWVAG